MVAPPGDQPPLHVHNESDEGFYLLEGEVTFWAGDAERRLGPGDFVLGAEGRPAHLPRDERDAGALVVTSSTGEFAAFVQAYGAPRCAARAARAGGPPDVERLGRLAAPSTASPARPSRHAARGPQPRGVPAAAPAEVEQPRERQADDVEVVALDPRDERRAAALDGVAAGAALATRRWRRTSRARAASAARKSTGCHDDVRGGDPPSRGDRDRRRPPRGGGPPGARVARAPAPRRAACRGCRRRGRRQRVGAEDELAGGDRERLAAGVLAATAHAGRRGELLDVRRRGRRRRRRAAPGSPAAAATRRASDQA